jgi:hypothetical protein
VELVEPAVAKYIAEHGLYRPMATAETNTKAKAGAS